MSEDKQYIMTCQECRLFTSEMLKEDREAIKEDFRKIVKEEWQISGNTIERVDRLENIQSWLIVVCLAQTLAIIYLFTKIM